MVAKGIGRRLEKRLVGDFWWTCRGALAGGQSGAGSAPNKGHG